MDVFVCGPDVPCPVDNKPCDEDGWEIGKDPYIYDDAGNVVGGGCSWGSVCCSRCGRAAMEKDMWG